MSTRQPYRNAKDERVPSVTTILGRFKECGGLMYWAWQCGQDGKDFRDERDKAATVGTAAHKMVECFIRKETFDRKEFEKDILKAAEVPFLAFRKWASLTKLKPVKTELRLISEIHQFGGMLDAASVEGELCIFDWKTSNSVYSEYVLQVAAYRGLWNENFPKKRVTVAHLVRFGKEDDDFNHHYFSESFLDEAWEAFVLERKLYDILKHVEKRLG